GLHVVVPLAPEAEWDKVKPFCKALAELMSQEHPDRYLPTTKKADRKGRILIDWLRNGMGATAVASFCPRARPGATVATPIGWEEVDHDLDPAVFTLRTIPKWLSTLKTDPWEGFDAARRPLPRLEARAARPASADTGQATRPPGKRPPGKRPVIVTAAKPRRR